MLAEPLIDVNTIIREEIVDGVEEWMSKPGLKISTVHKLTWTVIDIVHQLIQLLLAEVAL